MPGFPVLYYLLKFAQAHVHWVGDGREFEQALGVGDGQGSIVCCSPLGCKESDGLSD